MSNKRDKKKDKNDNTWLFVLFGALGVGGLFVWARSQAGDDSAGASAGASAAAGAGASAGAIGKSLSEVTKKIREATLVVDGCTVTWRSGETSRSELLTHRDDFFIPAIADARAKGAVTVDEITAHLAALLVPGCPWPPTVLQAIDIENAVDGKLGLLEKQAWNIAQTSGAVRLYLTIRQVVAVLAMQQRRG